MPHQVPDKPDAVLFDFDGVIADSEPLHFRAFRETANSLGIDFSENEYYENLIGFDDRGAWRIIFELRGKEISAARLTDLMQRKTALIQDLLERGELKPLRGVGEFLEHLAALGIPAAIYSGALRAELEPMLKSLFSRSYFKCITCADDVPRAKPDPMGYLLTAQRLSQMIGQPLAPADCLVIEDSRLVADNAMRAGFNVIGVTTSAPADRWAPNIVTVACLDELRFEK